MSKKGGQKAGLEPAASKGKPVVKATPTNAWNRPLKAKTTTGPPPGLRPADKAKPQKTKTNGAETNTILRERLLHLSLTLVGHKVVLAQTNGAVLEGIFHTFTPFPNLSAEMKNKYVLNTVKTVKQPTSGEHIIKDGSTVIIPVDKVMYIQAKNVNLDRPTANGFGGANNKNDVTTDTQISGSRGDKDLELVSAGSAWTAGAGKSRADASAGGLDDKGGMTRKGFGTARPAGLKGSIGEWDQFKANEELFNVQDTYDENLYTTELDKSQIDTRKRAEAERIAKEIENTKSTNLHVAEERGHIVETDLDEEDRYSGVLTKDGKQRHQTAILVKDGKAAPKKMNYAAAAAKADAGKKVAPPGFPSKSGNGKATPTPAEGKKDKPKQAPPKKQGETAAKKEADSEKKDKPKEAEKPAEKEPKKEEKADDAAKDKEEKKDVAKEGEKTETTEKPKSKLSAKAKSFTFNPSAKSFTPNFGGGSNFSTPAPQQQPQHADPNAHMHAGAHPGMQAPHYMHAGPMGQPGMMPMMNQQFQGMRYPPQYQGVDQHMTQMQTPQPQHTDPAAAPSPAPPADATGAGNTAAASAASGEDETASQQQQEDDGSQQTAPQQQPQQNQQQQIPMQYNVPPPGTYYGAGGMPMHPRGPGYPPQFVGGPQQMPVAQGGGRYPMYPMQPGGMPPNMHMRGPGGAPYYPGPGGPVPYPPGAYGGHGMMEEGDQNFRDRGGRGQGGRSGRGRRGGRGRGRGGYNNSTYSGNNSGRNTPQQQQQGSNESSVADGSNQDSK